MDAKEYFQQIYDLTRKIEKLELIAEEYDRLSYSVPGPVYGKEVTHSPNVNTEAPFVKWIHKKMEKEEEIKKAKEKLTILKAEAMLLIDTLENPTEQLILTYRYIDLWGWKKISKKLNYAESYIFELHREATEIITKTLQEKEHSKS